MISKYLAHLSSLCVSCYCYVVSLQVLWYNMNLLLMKFLLRDSHYKQRGVATNLFLLHEMLFV